MAVMTAMPERFMNLVEPLGHKPTDRRTTDTAAQHCAGWSGAVSPLIGASLRQGDVDSSTLRSTPATTRGPRTSSTATATTTTRTTASVSVPSADSCPDEGCDFNLAHPSFQALVQAYINCTRTKRNSASVLAFDQHLERNLCDLYDELVGGSYRPGRSICFAITHPKPREVWAASIRDRIVHWLLYSHIAPRFHAGFVADSCACIPGRGTLYGAQRLEAQGRSCTRNWARPAHYLKCDLANFFVSIDKHVLRERIAARVHEPWWLALADTILFHDPRTDVVVRGRAQDLCRVPPHKSLFNAPPDTGLPIGNLSSQFFANVLLDALDQRVKHRLRAPYFVRYVDDFILLHPSSAWLTEAHRDIEAWLPERLRLHLNPRKTVRQPVARGVDFVGQVVQPWRRTSRRRTLASALQRIEEMPAAELFAAGNSYLGLVRQATHSHSERAALCRALLKRGHAVEGMHLSKIFRKGME